MMGQSASPPTPDQTNWEPTKARQYLPNRSKFYIYISPGMHGLTVHGCSVECYLWVSVGL
uniref:Uncharacterized protein n=1 Tax=Anguilla anguilla TaxID=7936 RepID=A0A0E9R1S6_ANGAN